MKSAGSIVCIFLALQAAGAAAQAFVCSSDADCAFSVTNQNGLFCAPNNFCNCCRSGPPMTPAPTTGGGTPGTPAPTATPGTPNPPPTNNGRRVSGITYQPFAPGSSICRDLGSLNVHLNQMRELADNIRIYSISVCPAQTDRIMQFAEANNMKVVLGLFINNDGGNNEREINQLPGLLSRYANTIMEVSVGNEALFVLKVPYETLVGYIRRAKSMRDAAGVNVPVSTAEVWPTWESDTGLQLVQEVDTIHMNMQPFWEGFYVTCPAGLPYPCANAGDYVWLKADGLQSFFGKPLLVTETGWPSEPAQESCCDGTRDNALSGLHAVPSVDNARTFWSQVISGGQQRGRPYFMHTFADEEWKRQWAPCTECRGLNICLNGNQCELEYHWGRKTSNLQFKW